jgi:hypothetical protein
MAKLKIAAYFLLAYKPCMEIDIKEKLSFRIFYEVKAKKSGNSVVLNLLNWS